jgi:hypothetical protein
MQLPNKQRPKPAKSGHHKINNWREYNQALKLRGSLEIWIEDGIESKWYYQGKTQQGAQFIYSKACIELAAVLRVLYHLPYRQLEGFLISLVKRSGWSLDVPDYTVIHRRTKTLNVKINEHTVSGRGKKYIVIDSTGLKVYGEGEWKVRQHGYGKRRSWMKMHLAIDESTAIIESCETTTNTVDDAEMVQYLLENIKDPIAKIAGDGAYDVAKVYEIAYRRKIKAIIPPRRNAKIHKHGNRKDKPLIRDENIRGVRQLGRRKWKEKNNYHRRSMAETAMFRFKVNFGDKLMARTEKQQEIEVQLKCKILNQMTRLGMPKNSIAKKAA